MRWCIDSGDGYSSEEVHIHLEEPFQVDWHILVVLAAFRADWHSFVVLAFRVDSFVVLASYRAVVLASYLVVVLASYRVVDLASCRVAKDIQVELGEVVDLASYLVVDLASCRVVDLASCRVVDLASYQVGKDTLAIQAETEGTIEGIRAETIEDSLVLVAFLVVDRAFEQER